MSLPLLANRVLVAALAGLLVLLVAPPLARAQTSVEVRVASSLDPASVTVAPGTTVTWVNADSERHRMRSRGPDEFDSGNLEPGERFSHTFRLEGTTSYVDDRDRDDTAYHGTVVVTAKASPSAQPGATEQERDAAEPSGPATHAVSMADRRFSPPTLEVTTGDTVTFVNDDDREHTATGDQRSFDSGILQSGQEFQHTFTTAGTFSYLCLLHPDMTGTIAVADPGGTAPPPSSPPEPDPSPTTTPDPSPSPDRASPDAGASAPERRTVQMRDFSFAPATTQVSVGSTVVFDNAGQALHTATAADGSFDSDLVAPGDAWERRFDRPGTFAYTCSLHPEMVGEVVVTATPGGAAAPADGDPTGGSATTTTPPDDDRTEVGEDLAASPGGGSSDPSAPAAVSVVDDAFLPEALEVSIDQEVVWTNDGEAVHTVTAQDGSFDSGLVAAGETFAMRFEEPGTVAYLCSVHPGMTGEVRVLALADASSALDVDTAAAVDGDGGRLSVATLELLMLGAFAVALAGFTALTRRVGAVDAAVDA